MIGKMNRIINLNSSLSESSYLSIYQKDPWKKRSELFIFLLNWNDPSWPMDPRENGRISICIRRWFFSWKGILRNDSIPRRNSHETAIIAIFHSIHSIIYGTYTAIAWTKPAKAFRNMPACILLQFITAHSRNERNPLLNRSNRKSRSSKLDRASLRSPPSSLSPPWN